MKFQHILFPIDFSDCSRTLAREVEYLADRFQAEVTLLHVMEIPFTWYGSGEAPLMNADCILQLVEQKREELKNFAINVPKERLHRIVAEGDAAWQIKDYARDHNVDLIVMGTHGYGSMRRMLLGSVAMKVLHDAGCPVWTHSPGKSMNGELKTGVKKIVCALELNQETVPLLRFVSNIAGEFGASVRLIHSVPDDASRPYRYFDTDLHRFLVKQAEEEISKVQDAAGTYFEVDLVEEPIAHAIAMEAAKYDADLVIIGRGKTQEIFGALRTHTYDIIREAPCPVLSYSATANEMVTEDLAACVGTKAGVTS